MSGKVLIVDDVATNRIVLKVKLSAAYYEVIQSGSGAEAIEIASRQRPDLILASACLPDLPGAEFLRALSESPDLRTTPVVMIVSDDTAASRIAALENGADDALAKPLQDDLLLARLRSLMRQRHSDDELQLRATTFRALGFAEPQPGFSRPARVAVVATQQTDAMRLRTALQQTTGHLFIAATTEQVFSSLARSGSPDAFIVLIDAADPDNSLRLLAELRSGPVTRSSAVIALLPTELQNLSPTILDMGVNDVLTVSPETRELALRLGAQLRYKQAADHHRAQLKDGLRAAVIDPLTGLFNRRYAMPYLDRLIAAEAEERRDFAVMVVDLDHFKSVNDRFGHAAGDTVLTRIADLLRGNLRDEDMVARIGGEEFLIVIPDTTRAQARQTAARMCRVVQRAPIPVTGLTDPVRVTVSIGVAIGHAAQDGTRPSAADLLAQADRALYNSKADGRNTVTMSSRSAA